MSRTLKNDIKSQPQILSINNPKYISQEFRQIGLDPETMKVFYRKGTNRILKIKSLSISAAETIKNLAFSIEADAAISPRNLIADIIIVASLSKYRKLIESLKSNSDELRTIAEKIDRAFDGFEKNYFDLHCNSFVIHLGRRTNIMGVLNVTPDSFSDGGKFDTLEKALKRAYQLGEEGSDIIDIGGESTRPGALEVSVEEEIERTIPVIKEVSADIQVPISIDTRKARVAEQAVKAGASIINDISAFSDPAMAPFVADAGLPVVIMHMKGTPRTMQIAPHYEDLIAEILQFFSERIDYALSCGIKEENIIIDPGIGFGKTVEHNFEIIDRLDEFKIIGRPILIGPSRKSFIGKVLNLDPDKRLMGTAAAISACILKNAHIVRVHDVKEMKQVCQITDRIKNR